ncbi:Hsp20/alpha crystallin family protein [Methanosalsum natronophilum]|uniref:Hsp20/alpha crystallin family protein n=1 Tax=Methanosalsum natronophilum TaxID=768733 RepID=A0A3R7YJW0_9EURY|nr:Hsp20/alpha crystallin family protein [Methanosalsum natronophilum]MCS3923447.1 HSP20 family molecular chaperone IbpA [Methanosalsum natronophilum]RQD92307.1 MAG: Hsp20/alpha crystallin family protein [Methanosalsum natronophilum]
MDKSIEYPYVYEYSDEANKTLNLEISLPGVKKKNVELKINEKSFSIKLRHKKKKYRGTYPIFCAVDANKAIYRYEKGKIKISAPKWS